MQAGTMMLTYLFPQNAKFLQLLLHVTTPNPEFVRVGTPIVFRDGSAGAENLSRRWRWRRHGFVLVEEGEKPPSRREGRC